MNNNKFKRALSGAILILFVFSFPAVTLSASEFDSCTQCHDDNKLKVRNKKLYEYFQNWTGSAHETSGVSCSDCHGGNPEEKTKELAHEGILQQSDPESALNFRNIPKTCGMCHSEIKDHFMKSEHYRLLQKTGSGPNCVTCHSSMSSRTYFKAIVVDACATCHNEKTKNHPEIVEQSRTIMKRLSHAEGYQKWAEFYYESTGRKGEIQKMNKLVDNIHRAWHEFNFKDLDKLSKELLNDLKGRLNDLKKEKKGKAEKK